MSPINVVATNWGILGRLSMKTLHLCTTIATTTLLFGCAVQPLPPGDTSSVMTTPYTLGPGDKVRITTFGFKEMSGEFIVAADSSISLPLAGTYKVTGLTPPELAEQIRGDLLARKLVRNPQVSAEVFEYRPYYVLGEVTKPGQYPFSNGLTVEKAVATAQGYSYRANKKKILITRDGTRVQEVVDLTATTPVHPGDTIKVAERHF